MPHIETSRLILRPFTGEDAKAASYNSTRPIVAHFMSDMILKTEDEARGWIEWIADRFDPQRPFAALAIERRADAAVVGRIGVAPKKELGDEIEILFSVADDYQGNGYATEAGRAMIWWAFEVAGQDMLSAIVKPANRASRRVIEKLGFIYCDTRTLNYDGGDCAFDYFRLYHTDVLPGPEWDARSLDIPEPMGAFFDARVDGYEAHMLSNGGEEVYGALGGFFPETDEAIEVLDLGCGSGLELNYLWAKAPNARVTCVDMSRGMLKLLLKNHREMRKHITTVEASYLEWQYPDSAYDLAVTSATLHHLRPSEKKKVYGKILRALKPGGTYLENDFIVDAPHAEQYRRRYEIITAQLPKGAGAGEYHIDVPCSIQTQQALLRESGFRSVYILFDGIKPRGSVAIICAGK